MKETAKTLLIAILLATCFMTSMMARHYRERISDLEKRQVPPGLWFGIDMDQNRLLGCINTSDYTNNYWGAKIDETFLTGWKVTVWGRGSGAEFRGKFFDKTERAHWHPNIHVFAKDGELFGECGACGELIPLRLKWGTNDTQATLETIQKF